MSGLHGNHKKGYYIFGPFIFIKEKHPSFTVLLDSGDYLHEWRHSLCSLRISFFCYVVILELPQIINPWISDETQRAVTNNLKSDRGSRVYGFVIQKGCSGFYFGRYKWGMRKIRDLLPVSLCVYTHKDTYYRDLEGNEVVRIKTKASLNTKEWKLNEIPSRKFGYRNSGDQQILFVTVRIRDIIYTLGSGWFGRKKRIRFIDLERTQYENTGEQHVVWRNCISFGEQDKNILHEEAFRKFCNTYGHTHIGPVDTVKLQRSAILV